MIYIPTIPCLVNFQTCLIAFGSFCGEVLEKLRLDGYQDMEIAYAALKLNEGKLIEFSPSIDAQGHLNTFQTGNLTYKGHSILDNIRDDSVWSKAKEKVGTIFSSVSLSIVAGVAESYIKSKFGI